jgi:hypothetical protein
VCVVSQSHELATKLGDNKKERKRKKKKETEKYSPITCARLPLVLKVPAMSERVGRGGGVGQGAHTGQWAWDRLPPRAWW